MKPKVSVIMPAYNCDRFIQNAIKSVFEDQEYENIELIVVNDNSTDSTLDLVNKFRDSYPQIVAIKNVRRKGPSGARNTGLLKATGEYLSFLDADDIWLPGHLNNGIRFLEQNHKIDAVFYNFSVVDYYTKEILFNWFSKKEFTTKLKTKKMAGGYFLICDDMFNALLRESFLHLQSMILRKDICQSILFNENVRRSEDRDFGIQLSINSKANFAYNNTITGIFYRHQNSLTDSNIDNNLSALSDHIYLFNYYLKKYAKCKYQSDYLKKILRRKFLSKAYLHRKKSELKLALISTFYSMRYNFSFGQIKELLKIIFMYLTSIFRKPSN